MEEILHSILTHWPEFRRELPWRNLSDPWKIFLSELLLLQTDAIKASSTYATIVEQIPDPYSVLEMGVEKLAKLLRPLGLHKLRAKWLFEAAKCIIEEYNGIIPVDKEKLLKIPGIGNYIASVIAICCGKTASPLDVNIARVLSRVFLGKDPPTRYSYDKILRDMSMRIKWSRELLYAILDFAAEICKSKNPMCNKCPIHESCAYFKEA
ncbi:MAG: hypothetical protein QXK90_03820 [Candidatus Parvarchaeota archaeon]